MCTCVHLCIHLYMRVHVCTCVRVCMHACLYVCVCIAQNSIPEEASFRRPGWPGSGRFRAQFGPIRPSSANFDRTRTQFGPMSPGRRPTAARPAPDPPDRRPQSIFAVPSPGPGRGVPAVPERPVPVRPHGGRRAAGVRRRPPADRVPRDGPPLGCARALRLRASAVLGL